MGLSIAVARIFDIIFLLLIISILLTWVPTINWGNEPFRSLKVFTEIFLSPLRKVIPPVGGLDFSPIVTLFFLEIIRKVLVVSLSALGL